MDRMAILEREFYRMARGAKPTDQDAWRLVCDDKLMRLFVRHEWQSGGETGVREYAIDEFVAGHGGPDPHPCLTPPSLTQPSLIPRCQAIAIAATET
jgi:hypothetical protein